MKLSLREIRELASSAFKHGMWQGSWCEVTKEFDDYTVVIKITNKSKWKLAH